MVRGFLARRDRPKRDEAWTLLFDFVIKQGHNYYQVRTYKAPEFQLKSSEYPYMVVVARYLHPRDTFKLYLVELPYEGETCKNDMIDSIEILTENHGERNIRMVRFKQMKRESIEPIAPVAPVQPVIEEVEI